MKVIYRGNSLFFKQTRLTNKHIQADLALTEAFMYQVEVDIVKDRYKVCDESPLRSNRLSSISNI